MENYFTELTEKQADLILLVLESQGISPDYIKSNNSFDILVNNTDNEKAVQILEKYFAENINKKSKVPDPFLSWKSPGIFFIMAILCLFHFYSQYNGIHEKLIKEYGSSGLYILQGEYFRAVTSLLFHADIEHLAGNLLGLFVFGTSLFSLTGYGRGSIMLILSGFFGNITNAYFKKGVILSIGASTSILGAAGILTALQIAKRRKTSLSNIQILAPFAAGMALLGFLSGGENTDISAHLFGFLWGFIIGFFYSTIIKEKQKRKSDNIIYAVISIIFVSAAWLKYF